MNPRIFRNSFIWVLVAVALVAILFTLLQSSGGQGNQSLGWLIEQARGGNVTSIEVSNDSLKVMTVDNREVTVNKEPDISVFEMLTASGVEVGEGAGQVDLRPRGSSGLGSLFGLFINFLPLIFFGAILIFFMRQAQGGNSQALNFGRSRARMFMGNRPAVSFSDVAGVEEAKIELEEVVEFLKYPEKFASLGARIPRGVLLVGPPGGGKTLLARAVAGEAGVPFFSISGSEFVEMFVGVGASRVRDLFDQAKRNAPAIVFVDEIDAVGRHRGAGLGGGHDEREQTLNQILVEMDGFDSSTNVIVIAATNRPDILDPALLRPGRFDRRVTIDLPDVRGRIAILDVHARGKPLDPEIDMEVVAKQTPGFSGADLANLINEAAILAARRNKKLVMYDELAEAVDRVFAGPERKSRLVTEREKRTTAYHEAGHAVVGHLVPNADPVQKVTIVARGMMGGYTRFLPREESMLRTKSQLLDAIKAALGGRAAEEIVFGDISTGASNDIEQVTRIARSMITTYGMSDKLGPLTLGKREEMIFLGREISEQRNYGERVADVIDQEVNDIVFGSYDEAKRIINENRHILDRLAEYLMVEETVEGDDLQKLLNDEPIDPKSSDPDPDPVPVPAT
ncbi:MAG: ATP-dependent zinc metalloprotease FtsH [Dehalococcoidia bacterium]|nr:ATP-dependent zinc metalloprotease FtsH [Dehalococcoidia bacterium]